MPRGPPRPTSTPNIGPPTPGVFSPNLGNELGYLSRITTPCQEENPHKRERGEREERWWREPRNAGSRRSRNLPRQYVCAVGSPLRGERRSGDLRYSEGRPPPVTQVRAAAATRPRRRL